MTLIKCNNPSCVFHPRGYCVQVQLIINGDGNCMDALTKDEYKKIVKDEMIS